MSLMPSWSSGNPPLVPKSSVPPKSRQSKERQRYREIAKESRDLKRAMLRRKRAEEEAAYEGFRSGLTPGDKLWTLSRYVHDKTGRFIDESELAVMVDDGGLILFRIHPTTERLFRIPTGHDVLDLPEIDGWLEAGVVVGTSRAIASAARILDHVRALSLRINQGGRPC